MDFTTLEPTKKRKVVLITDDTEARTAEEVSPPPKRAKTSTSPATAETDAPAEIPSNLKAPRVVKLKRSGGVVVQGCDVYIGRRICMGGWNLEGSKWANPFKRDKTNPNSNNTNLVVKFEEWIRKQPALMAAVGELSGKVLGCWCKPDQCHGDVLVKLWKEKYGKQAI